MKRCIICGARDTKGNRSVIERHHISYHPEAVILLCRPCHQVITRYERGSTEYWDEKSMDIISVYNKINPTDYINYGGEVISARIPVELAVALRNRAKAKNQTLSEYLTTCIQYIIKQGNTHKVATRVNTIKTPSNIREQKYAELQLDADGNKIYEEG